MRYGVATAYGPTYQPVFPAGATTDNPRTGMSQADSSARKLMLAVPVLAIAGYAIYSGLEAAKHRKQAKDWR